jgi:arginine/lysine/ornithine decarboxylase
MLHRTGDLVAKEKLQAAVNMFQTSSPSYLLLASIDGCIGLLEEQGEVGRKAWEEALAEFYREACKLRHIRVVAGGAAHREEKINEIVESGVYDRDRSKIVICTRGTDLSGAVLMERLRNEFCIEVEMAAEQYVIAMTGMGDTKESLVRLLQALLDIVAQCENGQIRDIRYPDLPTVRMSAAEAARVSAKEYRWEDAVGKIAAEYVWAYPPGIPLLVPGEEIGSELVSFLMQKEAAGVRIHRTGGGNGEAICCLQV